MREDEARAKALGWREAEGAGGHPGAGPASVLGRGLTSRQQKKMMSGTLWATRCHLAEGYRETDRQAASDMGSRAEGQIQG